MGMYLVQTTVFVKTSVYSAPTYGNVSNKSLGQLSGLKFIIFISHKRSRVWKKYFIRLYIIISSICVIFFINLDDFFAVICTSFHEVVVCTRYVPPTYARVSISCL